MKEMIQTVNSLQSPVSRLMMRNSEPNKNTTEMTEVEQVWEFLEPLFFKRGISLNPLQKEIIRCSWNNEIYDSLEGLGFSVGFIKRIVAPALWKSITRVLREEKLIKNNDKVQKKNFKLVIEPIIKYEKKQDFVGYTIANRFKILSLNKRGEFGNTYIGEDLELNNQRCFIKQLRFKSNTDIQKNFQREAGALYQLGWHRQIPGLLAHFEDETGFFLVHQFISGTPLNNQLSEHETSSPWNETKVIELIGQVLTVLDFIHKRNIIHRDIKPSNLIIKPDGEIVIINFGSVKNLDKNNNDRTFKGTRGYMAPEQIYGIPTQSNDLYSLAMLGIQALTGLPPLDFKINYKNGQIILPKQTIISKELKMILEKMGHYDFQQRYQSVSEVLKDFKKIL
ncbi:MAG: serine/threonine-protein kinase [Crocosphaera sp.]|nr:serine/threonine-protein kinase [Crocosphaera sp.]